MQQPTPPISAPIVWAELVTSDPARLATALASALGWKATREPGTTDQIIYLDHARQAGPICGIRPRTPSDPLPEGLEGAPDRWTVRLSPPRPPRAADPAGDQLLRPRAPGPRIGRWALPNALCFAELWTDDVGGARDWMQRRLDAALTTTDDGALLLASAVDPSCTVGCVRATDDGFWGWIPAVQVASLEATTAKLRVAGVEAMHERAVPPGCTGSAAVDVLDSGGSRLTLVEHGPVHGRR